MGSLKPSLKFGYNCRFGFNQFPTNSKFSLKEEICSAQEQQYTVTQRSQLE